MSEDRAPPGNADPAAPAGRAGRFFGSLRDALLTASRDEPPPAGPTAAPAAAAQPAPEVVDEVRDPAPSPGAGERPSPSAAEAARQARGADVFAFGACPFEPDASPTTRGSRRGSSPPPEDAARTQLVRGKAPFRRGAFEQDPVVGWLVVVGGPGIGCCRPVFEGNNAIGRAPRQRIPLDFGDESISSEEQAYIRYDSSERSFLFVPNLAKTNVVSVNDARPTAAVELQHMDVITIGRTQLVFVPFCGAEFDWSDIAENRD
jgi:FHA domain-containing protein